jgi:hypothetical protein
MSIAWSRIAENAVILYLNIEAGLVYLLDMQKEIKKC